MGLLTLLIPKYYPTCKLWKTGWSGSCSGLVKSVTVSSLIFWLGHQLETMFDADCNLSHTVVHRCCYCDVRLFVLVECCLHTVEISHTFALCCKTMDETAYWIAPSSKVNRNKLLRWVGIRGNCVLYTFELRTIAVALHMQVDMFIVFYFAPFVSLRTGAFCRRRVAHTPQNIVSTPIC